jgi:predicted nucleic acid-binding protein
VAGTADAPGLIDTDILIDASRPVPVAITYVAEAIAAGTLEVSVVTAMELIQGCRNQAALGQVRRLLRRAVVLPVDGNVSQRAHALMDTFFLSHGLLIPDALIAATALEHSLTLYTRNVRDFQMIPGLIVQQPH